ncbi:OLC1v1006424C1 [Oldenlandia corymbosa var. corymbosa]|uniref:OLC1v1006424C1 n=1 Tax=Oldenlandia corymbosa var. corymbosa TaxID=529605 RepID=A0AAV1DHL0_OLDCO|nr:OLC1v1006424C1 [Oldenlandia corymbosa var. corymbosa]
MLKLPSLDLHPDYFDFEDHNNIPTHRYKLLKTCRKNSSYFDGEILTIGVDSSWRTTLHDKNPPISSEHTIKSLSACLDGVLCWTDDNGLEIGAFDLAKEKFIRIPSPLRAGEGVSYKATRYYNHKPYMMLANFGPSIVVTKPKGDDDFEKQQILRYERSGGGNWVDVVPELNLADGDKVASSFPKYCKDFYPTALGILPNGKVMLMRAEDQKSASFYSLRLDFLWPNHEEIRLPSDHQRIPDDSVRKILTRLPVKSLMIFKCVSPNWLSMIEDPSFTKSYTGGSRGGVLCWMDCNGLKITAFDLAKEKFTHIPSPFGRGEGLYYNARHHNNKPFMKLANFGPSIAVTKPIGDNLEEHQILRYNISGGDHGTDENGGGGGVWVDVVPELQPANRPENSSFALYDDGFQPVALGILPDGKMLMRLGDYHGFSNGLDFLNLSNREELQRIGINTSFLNDVPKRKVEMPGIDHSACEGIDERAKSDIFEGG